MLQRCTKALGMDIDIMGDTDDVSQAKQLMDGITARSTSGSQHSAFASLKELRISWQSRTTPNCRSQLASHMALASMAAAFHSLEVRARQPESCMPAQPAVSAVECNHEHLYISDPLLASQAAPISSGSRCATLGGCGWLCCMSCVI